MKLAPLPNILKNDFDRDSFVYENDTSLYYNSKVDINIIEDIRNKEMQIYTGYYEFEKGWDSPKIYLLGRGKLSGKFKIKVQNFKPYCYMRDDNGEFLDYLGNHCEKMVFKGMHPSNVKWFRERMRKKGRYQPYEADILFVRRFLIDMYDYFKPKEAIKPKIAIIDVETNFPINNDIIAWTLNDMKNPVMYRSKYDGLSPAKLAVELWDEIKKYDWITGWNVSFDVEVLQNALVKIWDELDISHEVAIIDLLRVSQKMHAREIRGRWSLDNVGRRLCGIGKVHIGPKHIKDLTEEELFHYSVMDAIIPEIIDKQLGGLEGHLILCWSLQSILDDSIITAVVNDIALLRAYHKAGIVLPSRDYTEKKSKEAKYDAAEPDARPGNYKGLIVTDIVHAYPWAVIGKNISPETKDPNGENIIEYVNKKGEEKRVCYNNKESVFIETLKDLMAERGKIKQSLGSTVKGSDEWRKLKSIDFALKTQAAAFSHGIFGWSNSRMRDYEVADTITAVVRYLIDRIKSACDAIGREWCYVHTDSCYINGTKEECDKIVYYLNDVIKKYCKGYLVKPELDFKNFYPYAYIHSPARNVLVPEDGDLEDPDSWDVTGMNFMRSETAEPLGEIETKLISLLFKGHTKEYMLRKLQDMIKELINVETTDLGVIKPLTKSISEYGKIKKDGTLGGIPYHIKALIKASEEYGFMVNVGEKFMIIPIVTGETTGKRVIKPKRGFMAYDIETGLPKKYTIDYEHYLKSNLWGKINNLFDMTPKELENEVMDDSVKAYLFAGML